MKRIALPLITLSLSLASLFSWSPQAAAIEFDEVRDFGDVFAVSATAADRKQITVRWDIAEGYYLYNNRFLQFGTTTPGVELGQPQIPTGETSFDDLLGEEVEKYHDELVVTLPLLSLAPGIEAVELNLRSQGCLENELCYPPTAQQVIVTLPPALNLGEPVGSGLLLPPPAAPGFLARQDAALPAEEAFVYEAIALDPATALVRFTAQPGYYLYVDKFQFTASGAAGVAVAAAEMPQGVVKDDPEFGPVDVYYGQVEIPVHFVRPAGAVLPLQLEADFQGCRDGDICYPPMARAVSFELPAAAEGFASPSAPAAVKSPGNASAAAAPASPPVSEQDRLARLLTGSPVAALAAFFVAGLLLAFTPCVFPMVPILSGIIVGQGERLTTLRAFWLSLLYVLSMAVTYTVAGVLAGLFGENLQAAFQNPWIISGFVLIFVLLALSMFGFYELQLPSGLQTRLATASGKQQGGALWGVVVMGFLSALIVGPCVAPPLMAALIVIGSSGDAVLGGAALFVLSLGMGVPLILFGISAGKLLPRAGAWMAAVKAVFGVGLLALAIWMLQRILPGAIIMLLWGVLAIGCAVFLGALRRTEAGDSGWRKLWQAVGIVLMTLGVVEVIGSLAGGDDWQRPLSGILAGSQPSSVESHTPFTAIKSVADLQQQLAGAAEQGRGAMLDFYADWCVECKRMERNTFPDPGVASLMDRMRLVQADVTANDDVDQELMRKFGIIGPPAILFFDRSGREMPGYRLVGYFDPEEFSAHLQQVLAAQ